MIKNAGLYAGGTGLTPDDPVIIKASNTREGVKAEYDFVLMQLGDEADQWEFLQQELRGYKGKTMDILIFVRGDETRKYYFDISQFFGT